MIENYLRRVFLFLNVRFYWDTVVMLKIVFIFLTIVRFHIIYWSHFIYSSENKMSGPRVHTRIFFVYFRTERMMWKKIDTLFSLGQWTEIKMKLSIFQCSTFLLAFAIVAVFFLFIFFPLYYFLFLSSIVRNSFSI